MPTESNRNLLGEETSPYLLQHAHNPVHWRPWGSEALAEARRRDCPILLSIGYAACHWCHVMAHESFENAETARRMNELFVNVKVDREERPDIDHIYMTALHALGQQGVAGRYTMFTRSREGKPMLGGRPIGRRSRAGAVRRSGRSSNPSTRPGAPAARRWRNAAARWRSIWPELSAPA